MPRYAELHAHSAYTFLEGTCLPRKLVDQAAELGLAGLAILEVDGMYSAVQMSSAAAAARIPSVFGAELTLEYTESTPEGWGLPAGSVDRGIRLPILVGGQQGYHALVGAMSQHNLASPGQRSRAWNLEELAQHRRDWVVLTGTSHGLIRRALRAGGKKDALRMRDHLVDLFGEDGVAIEANLRPDSPPALAEVLNELAETRNLPLVATGAVRCASPAEQALADVMAASKLNMTLEEARPHLPPFGTFLRSAEEMHKIHHLFPHAVENAADLSDALAFDLKLIAPELPSSNPPEGHSDASWLRTLTYRGAQVRYGSKTENPQAWQTIEHELQVIENLNFPGYFLIVKDIIDFCQRKNILAQGRGSAANSAVCYALGITAVDAVKHRLMFERFLSEERRTPPDIDIDIESEQREQVIQYVYDKYGRERAAQVANTITYRPRSAVKAVGKALGFAEPLIENWAKGVSRGGEGSVTLPPLVSSAAAALQKLPRHMGIHPGGMVLTKTPVSEICPVMWAAKEDRTVLQWDKEDCADAGLVKFDLLGLGMLTALRKSFSSLSARGVRGTDGRELGLYNLPDEHPRVYDLLCAAETVGVFQVESRAQMGTLPRMQPRDFYDLVIEIALIRPGPIQGQAVNPYLDRRNGRALPDCHPLLADALDRTLGVPIFQEQLMRIAVDAAGFTPSEADQLRRAIGSKHSAERMREIKPKLFEGLSKNNFTQEMKDQIYDSLKGFAEFGFPESHAFSFAFLVYASAWLKTFYPEHFYAGLLASQPMGFYSPASLIADAKKLGVKVTAPSVQYSGAEAQVEGSGPLETGDFKLLRVHPHLSVRLGLDAVGGLSKEAMTRIIEARSQGQFTGLADFAERTHLARKELDCLARADAFADLGVSRREALWFAAQLATHRGVSSTTSSATAEWQPVLTGFEITVNAPDLPSASPMEVLRADWKSMGLSVRQHPLEFQREQLRAAGVLTAAEVASVPAGEHATVAGVVTHRQRPGTAKGVTFLSLEDETGLVNVVVSVGAWKRFRKTALNSRGLLVSGKIERKDRAYNLQAQKIEPLPLPVLTRSRDFH